MTQSFDDAVAKFSGEVEDAVSRARRAAAEARDLTARFREETREGAAESGDEEPEAAQVPPSTDEDDDFSQEQIMTRDQRSNRHNRR
ncbi:hypothetical protein KIPE111705_44275 [Kibdelosporangium persicum]|uniref:Uncharacterized protein n=1 Tax=Kibdelosporangium persicum TaxID=2698649 RepID=A0ABX2F0I3_9PSEU|nr:hypothetical protein [Kibdelosporangium persicum]NRN64520.1 hypothetical protein [Kibdelosporangium persicum]